MPPLAALLLGQIREARHGATRHTARHRLEQVLICRQKTRRCGPNLEKARGESARLRVKPYCRRAVTFTLQAMAGGAMLLIDRAARAGGRSLGRRCRRRSAVND